MFPEQWRLRRGLVVLAALSATTMAPERSGRADLPGEGTPTVADDRPAPSEHRDGSRTGHWNDPSWDFPFVPGETPHSISFGDTSDGSLIGAERLSESQSLKILPHQRQRPYQWGTSELVRVLEHTGKELHRQTGTPLFVGHLSKQRGGDIPYSVSHNAGRDADIAFCYRDADGHPVDPDELIPIMGDGNTTRRGVFFDVARTWLVVKALITQHDAQVQYLFMSRPLEGKLLMHAKARGEPKAVRSRAEQIIHQAGPRAALHHDHIHLRLYCSRDDVLAGCRNTGRVHPFAKLYRHDKARFAMGLRKHLKSDDSDVRRRAIDRIGLLGAKLLGAEVAARLDDPSAEVQRAAAVTLTRFGEKRHLRIVRRWKAKLDPDERLALARILAERREPEAGELLGELLDEAGREARAMVALCGEGHHLQVVPALVRRLADPDHELRNRAATALGRLTGHRYVADWSKLSGRPLELARQKWRSAWAAGHTLDRRQWLMRGFHEAGFEAGRLEPDDAWSLVAALSGPDHVAANASAQLTDLFDERGDCSFWRTWLGKRRAAFELPPPPRRLCPGGGLVTTAK
jgi:penicillin-insensitive murein endopeptidase